jgi:hypothetical protein
MIGKFDAYDFIAVVIPGIFFIWVLGVVLEVLALGNLMPRGGDLAQTSMLVVQGYIIGLLLQGISQHLLEHVLRWAWGGLPSERMLLPQDKILPDEYKRNLVSLIKKKFNITISSDKPSKIEIASRLKENHSAFRLCYRSIDKLTETPSVFNAQYGLFRCLLAMFLLFVLIDATFLISLYVSGSGVSKKSVIIGIFLLLGAWISYLRTKKRAHDFSRSVYDYFCSHFSSDIA